MSALPRGFRVAVADRQALATQGRGVIAQSIEHALLSGIDFRQGRVWTLRGPASQVSAGLSQQQPNRKPATGRNSSKSRRSPFDGLLRKMIHPTVAKAGQAFLMHSRWANMPTAAEHDCMDSTSHLRAERNEELLHTKPPGLKAHRTWEDFGRRALGA